jgi:predicted amidophosphoribosyltransferase
MLDRETEARLSAALVARAGGYLRNPVRQDRVTCIVCATPVGGYARCFTCSARRASGELADFTAFLTYAVAGQQSGYVMHGYKARPRPVKEHTTVVALMTLLALSIHEKCPAALVGAPVTHWATVPSLPAKPGEHPMHQMVSKVAPGHEVTLAAAASCQNPRDVNRDHFSVTSQPLPGSHVLLIDDTWAKGGHAQSAVLSLRKAGAAHVSVLVVARWIKAGFGDNAEFLRSLADQDYNPEICPWTGGTCPPALTM